MAPGRWLLTLSRGKAFATVKAFGKSDWGKSRVQLQLPYIVRRYTGNVPLAAILLRRGLSPLLW